MNMYVRSNLKRDVGLLWYDGKNLNAHIHTCGDNVRDDSLICAAYEFNLVLIDLRR